MMENYWENQLLRHHLIFETVKKDEFIQPSIRFIKGKLFSLLLL